MVSVICQFCKLSCSGVEELQHHQVDLCPAIENPDKSIDSCVDEEFLCQQNMQMQKYKEQQRKIQKHQKDDVVTMRADYSLNVKVALAKKMSHCDRENNYEIEMKTSCCNLYLSAALLDLKFSLEM